MPSIKMKTHKGTKSRFKVSATGKVIHKRCGSSHLNSGKSGKRIRKLRRPTVLKNQTVARTLRRALQERNQRLLGGGVQFIPADHDHEHEHEGTDSAPPAE